MTSVLVVQALHILISFNGVSSYLIWPFEVGLMFNLLWHLIYWFFEYRIYCLRDRDIMGCLVKKFSPRPGRSEPAYWTILSINGESLSLTFTRTLIVLDLFMFFYPIHQLMHTPRWFHSKWFSQIGLSKKSYFEGLYNIIFKISINLFVYLLIFVKIILLGLSLSHRCWK